ncbi:GAF domain-containing protein [Nitrogeniibacter mangrovi]|uniref:GAF domain-containing protein n=2 Tax=Nitrogeniibacter mangrovi TaxID=2016596 RepID=A0A6C1B844_9RHOO|nr:GAF domain-containing protein [Nitrogeniibacter mangrovi]
MRTFIRVVEIWTPSRDGTVLEFQDGLYGGLEHFRLVSEKACFGYDEGLPGKAWAQRHPIVLRDLHESYFVRSEAAANAGLTCAVALPIFAGDLLAAVVVFFCGDDAAHVGAIELWHNAPEVSLEMSLVDGYFGHAEGFEWISRHISFRPGFGLPGLVWKQQLPIVMGDLGYSTRFLRAEEALSVGINKGIGLPSPYLDGQHYVITFLSALGTPIAHRFEVWVPDAAHKTLVFEGGDCDRSPGFDHDHYFVRIESGQGALGNVLRTGRPQIGHHVGEGSDPIARSAQRATLDAVVAVPVLHGGRLTAVAAMYF